MKVGLVLEGGGMRGLYTAGVLDAFFRSWNQSRRRCISISWSAFWC